MKKVRFVHTVVPDWPVICAQIADTDTTDEAIIERYKLPEFERIDLDGFLKDAGLKRGYCGFWHWLDESCLACALTAQSLPASALGLWRVKRGQMTSNDQQSIRKDND